MSEVIIIIIQTKVTAAAMVASWVAPQLAAPQRASVCFLIGTASSVEYC